MMTENDKRYGIESFILFLIFPFLGFIRACGRLRAPMCGLVFVLFYALFGYCHTFQDSRQDAFRIAKEFMGSHISTWEAAFHQFTSGMQPDLFKVGLFWLVGIFCKNPHVYFGVVGFIGAIFAYLAISRVLEDYRVKRVWPYFAIVLLLILIFKPTNIGGVRFWASMGLACYAALRVLLDRKFMWLIAFIIAPFIHFSMIAWLPIVLIAMFIKIPRKLLFWSAVICCIVGTCADGMSYQQQIEGIISSTGIENESVQSKASFYTSDSADKEFHKSLTTHIMKVVNYFNTAWFLLGLFSLRKKINALIRNNIYIYI